MVDLFRRGAFSVRGKKASRFEADPGKLLRRSRKLWKSSTAASVDPDRLAVDIAHSLAKDAGIDLPVSVLIAFADTVADLLFEGGLYLPQYDFDAVSGKSDAARLRRAYLRMQIGVLRSEAKQTTLLMQIIDVAFSHVIGHMGLSPACKLALSFAKPNDEGLSLRLIDYVEDVPAMVEGIVRAFFVVELQGVSMFSILRQEIERDIARASDLPPMLGHPSRDLIMPKEASWDEADELVQRYLNMTPFAELLLTELPVAFPDSARFEHTHIMGGSGHGKTQLMSQLILRDIEKAKHENRSIIVMDSQGDLIGSILALAHIHGSHLAEKLVVIDPTEFERPIALNPFTLDKQRLASYSPAERERTMHSAVSLFEYFFGELLGSELTAQQGTVFKFLIRLLVEIPGATLITLRDLMDNPQRFKPHIEKLEGSARAFFEREFLSGGYTSTRKQIARRLWAVLSNPVFERLFSSPVNRLDWFQLLQDGHIILINTAKDFLKPEGSRLLGRFLTAQIGQGILERAAISESQRTPTMFYIDEAHDQVDDTVDMLLSQGRKYKLGITLAHQHLDQLNAKQRSGLLSNTSIKLVGGVNRKDASTLAGEMNCSPDFLKSMRKREGVTKFAFSMRHMLDKATPLSVPLGLIDRQDQVAPEVVQAALELNRQRYGRDWSPEVFERPSVQTDPPAPKAEQQDVAEIEVEKPSIDQPAQKLPGRGSAAHKAEQERIRVLGSKLGYSAEVEKTLDHGLGAVDVALTNDKAKIAVEISITTPPEHEVANILKCLSAGFDYVIATAPDRQRLRAIEHAAWREVTAADSPKVLFLLPEDIEGFLASHREEPSTNKIMGYTVIVKKIPKSSEEKRRRRERLEWLLERIQNEQ